MTGEYKKQYIYIYIYIETKNRIIYTNTWKYTHTKFIQKQETFEYIKFLKIKLPTNKIKKRQQSKRGHTFAPCSNSTLTASGWA